MALKDYEGLWTVDWLPREHLISDQELRGRPRRKGPTKVQERKKQRRLRSKRKKYYKKYPHLKPKGPSLTKEQERQLKTQNIQDYYLDDKKERDLKKRRKKKDPYWMGHIVEYNGVKFFNWKYTARKLGKKPETFDNYVKRRIIPRCMYILGARQWRYYSEHQFKMLRYGFSKVKKGNKGWNLTDLAKYLYENWTKYEEPDILSQGNKNNSGGNSSYE